jgi:hypothetical protein
MGDIKKRMAIVRARRFNKYGDSVWDRMSFVALERATKYFGTNNVHFLAQAMAEVLFGRQEPGGTKGIKTWTRQRYLLLTQAYHEIKREHPRMSDTKIAELLCDDPDFKGDAENLRQRLVKAKREFERWAEQDAAAEYYDTDDY